MATTGLAANRTRRQSEEWRSLCHFARHFESIVSRGRAASVVRKSHEPLVILLVITSKTFHPPELSTIDPSTLCIQLLPTSSTMPFASKMAEPGSGHATVHPLDSLTERDISIAVSIVKKRYSAVKLRFKNAEVHETLKAELVPYLEAERLGLSTSEAPQRPPRIISLTFHPQDNKMFSEALVNIDSQKIISIHQLGDIQGPIDLDEYKDVEQACLTNSMVLKEIEKMKLPEGTKIICDPWIYGTDDPNETRRLAQCYM